jgi:hypothetical protein
MDYHGIPLTELMYGYKNRLHFTVIGDSSNSTQIYEFIDNVFESKKNRTAVQGVFGFIDETFPNCSHEKKFKIFEGQRFWEIKTGQIRIACFWNGKYLICFYGCIKKDNKWPKDEKKNAIKLYKELCR